MSHPSLPPLLPRPLCRLIPKLAPHVALASERGSWRGLGRGPRRGLKHLLWQGSEVAEAARQERRRLRAEYDDLRSKVFAHNRKAFPKEAFSLKKWLWACGLYDSRVIQLNRHTGLGNTPTWIPLVDMVNCIESQDKTFIQYDQSLKSAVMYADRPTAKGVQVFETYGNKSNYEYLMYNGFVMRDNPNDCVYVSLPSARGSRQVCISAKQGLPRLVHQWAQMTSGTVGSKTKEARLKAKDALVQFLTQRLSLYSTTQEEDAAELQSHLPESKVLAIEMRMHEKDTLSRLLQALESGAIDCCGM